SRRSGCAPRRGSTVLDRGTQPAAAVTRPGPGPSQGHSRCSTYVRSPRLSLAQSSAVHNGWRTMPDITARSLLKTSLVAIRDVHCAGRCRHKSDEESTNAAHMVFPYRGIYVRHLGDDDAVAEANQVLFFNAHDGYRVSHPVPGGDASLDLVVSEPELDELAPRRLRRESGGVAFRQQRLRIDPGVEVLAALLRHRLQTNIADALEGESLALTLARRALGPRTTHAPGATARRRRLVDRTKVILATDFARRW